MKESLHETHETTKLRKFHPYVVLALLLSMAISVWLFWSNRDAEKEQLRYDEQTKIIASKITDRFHNYNMVLQRFSGLFAVSEDVTRNDWRAYYEYRQVQTFFPGIQGIGFSRVVQPAELARHIQGIKAEGFPDYTVRPEGKRDVYTAIIFLEPFNVRNKRAFGYDMFSEPVRRAAMERARDTGAVSLSGKVTLVQEIGEKAQAGFLLYVPIYAKGVPLNTTEERRAALIGYVYSPFRMNNFMQGIFPDILLHGIEFEIYDGTKVSPAGLMYECDEHPITPGEKHKPMFSSRQTIDLYGHQWTLSFRSRPLFEATVDQFTSWGILAAGLVISLLIFFLIRGQEIRVMRRTEELNMTQKMLKSAFDYSPIGKALVALDGRFMRANDMLCGILGYTKEELLIKTFQELTHPDDLEADLAYMNHLLAGKINEYEMEKRYLHNQGQLIWAQLNVSLVRDSDSQPLFFISQIQNISRRKETDEKLREGERRFRDIAQSMADWIWEVDKNGKYTYVSDSVENILGYTPEEFLGKTPFEFMPEEEAAKIKEIFLEIVSRSGPIVDLENWNLAKDGTEICLIKSGVPIFNTDRELIGYRGVDKDITSRKKLEAEKALIESQLRQAQKMESIGRLAGGVAHDYNNALGVIIGYAEMAMIEMEPAEPLYADLDEILKAAKRAADITRQLLAFARKQTISPIMLDLNKTVEYMLKMLRRLIGEDIDFAWLPGESLGPIRIDPSQIDQILANLCVNARDAIKGVGKVTIETGMVFFDEDYCAIHAGFIPGEFVLLAVSDNGCGMDKEILNNIFEPFFTTKEVDKGTGLGLAMVYGIVKQNNGFINVYSEPDKGTTIKIYLPRHQGEAVEMQRDRTAEIPQGRGETLLLVEDDLPILKLARKILNGLGYTVLTADTPQEAIRLAEEHAGAIDLLVTDVVMPEMNGRKLADFLQSLYPEIKCLFMSGYTANVIAHHGVLDQSVYFIQKPFSQTDLAKIVRKALDEDKS